MLIVLDTNVLISGLLNRNGIPGQIVDMVIERKLRLAVNRLILDEYHSVTERPTLRINRNDRDAALSVIAVNSLRVDAEPLALPPQEILDSKDLPFAEVAVASQAQFLITGNKKHFGFMHHFTVPVVSPSEFIENVQSGE